MTYHQHMLILLSPSKTLDFTSPWPKEKGTMPEFPNEVNQIIEEFKKRKPESIQRTMNISYNLMKLTHKRFQNFIPLPTTENSKAAIFAFKGDVYDDVQINEYTEEELEFAQKHVRILSGLYGMLKPLDLIQEYRLEMKHKTRFWEHKLTNKLNEHMDQEGSKIVINLASIEYFRPINRKRIQGRILTPHFQEEKNGEVKAVPLFAKIARGTMTNFIVRNKITNPELIKNFQEDNYKFNENRSTPTDWYFVRPFTARLKPYHIFKLDKQAKAKEEGTIEKKPKSKNKSTN